MLQNNPHLAVILGYMVRDLLLVPTLDRQSPIIILATAIAQCRQLLPDYGLYSIERGYLYALYDYNVVLCMYGN